MALLPEDLPKWYTVEPTKERGWTPQTEDIIEGKGDPAIIDAWDTKGSYSPPNANAYTVRLDKLQIISPIQVGGGSFFEGGILPAQIGGVPCIPGSSIRGALLSWIQVKWNELPSEEQAFWQNLLASDRTHWLPRKIRFETIQLKNLKPYPLNAQQKWQLFDQKSKNLGIQWQVSPKPPTPNFDKFCLQVLLKDTSTKDQKTWLETRLKEMLQFQGIGRGKASGFGRLAPFIPSGTWEIQLTGMKPCVQSHKPGENQTGQYRWTPQVLRANLRSYFTRLALSLFSQKTALNLTDKIFGGLSCPAKLTLTSYLQPIPRILGQVSKDYANIPARQAHATWIISVDCNEEFKPLIGGLLTLASRLGGLGPGWRRPPHVLKSFYGFRGSEFTVTPANLEEPLHELIKRLRELITKLGENYGWRAMSKPAIVSGCLISIWQGQGDKWRDIVHKVCRSKDNRENPNPNRPLWCGDSETRPSGYAVRQYKDYCLITVFDKAVEATLTSKGFQVVWQC